jgi:hypothetical protein
MKTDRPARTNGQSVVQDSTTLVVGPNGAVAVSRGGTQKCLERFQRLGLDKRINGQEEINDGYVVAPLVSIQCMRCSERVVAYKPVGSVRPVGLLIPSGTTDPSCCTWCAPTLAYYKDD